MPSVQWVQITPDIPPRTLLNYSNQDGALVLLVRNEVYPTGQVVSASHLPPGWLPAASFTQLVSQSKEERLTESSWPHFPLKTSFFFPSVYLYIKRAPWLDDSALHLSHPQVLPSLRASCRWLRRFCHVCSVFLSTSTSTTLTVWARWELRLMSTPATSISITLLLSSTSWTTKSWNLWWVKGTGSKLKTEGK